MTFDSYLDQLPNYQRKVLMAIRDIVHARAQHVEEFMSYGMPSFKLDKKVLLHMGAFKDHVSIFPASDEMMAVIPELSTFRTSKGTLQITEAKPLNATVIEKIIDFRIGQIRG